jgi:hypothetical protein
MKNCAACARNPKRPTRAWSRRAGNRVGDLPHVGPHPVYGEDTAVLNQGESQPASCFAK